MATKTRKPVPGPIKVQPPGASKGSRSAKGAGKSEGKAPIVRVLPVLIFVGVLMLSLRVGDIFKGMFGLETVSVAELQAQQTPKAQPPAAPAATPAAATAPAQTAPAAPATAGSDPGAGMSQTELDVLQKLQERRGTLDVREKDIEKREALLKAAEDQIDRKVAEMKTLQNTIEGLLRQYNDQEDNKMRSLVKIYENMKPKEAAKIFEQLDMNILLEVVERMKEQRVAPIMAEMDPSKAKAVTAELAQRRQIPMPRAASGG
ncbi:MotE family protein [Paramagnetospirillum magneticum]|uniref:FlaA locus 229 kDa protein n=1 Tax=Paramagnetospirillum magneticum (strain ATCC 700264 / AMB-1) TaxID=342108 RepID=Q2W1H1_PARM1|nr:FlaA [Paramagnetospirillum magneticum]BAE52304.1 FlaA locus 229 kDa protein [Paramagnetospirillum magneticum AMB-1]